MNVNNFSLSVISDTANVRRVTDSNGTYFIMPDRTEYKLVLINNNAARADAHVWIDNNKVGVWRVNGFSQIVINRPAKINRKFTLLKEGSFDAVTAGIPSGGYSNGLVKVMFRPEMLRMEYDDEVYENNYNNYVYDRVQRFRSEANFPQNSQYANMMDGMNAGTYAGTNARQNRNLQTNNIMPTTVRTGVTGLGSYSDQLFRIARPIIEFDESRVTTIYARLLVNNNRRYIGLQHAGMYNSNRIPPRIDNYSRGQR